MTQPAGSGLFVIERILRDRDGIWRQIADERGLRGLIKQMLISSVISLAAFGVVLGLSYGWAQALSSMVKLPLLFLATLAICLPTLYLFNLVFGAHLSLTQAVSLIMVSITVTSVLTLAFAPISLFFLITAQSYSFYKLLNVAILIMTAIVGLRFLTVGMRALNAHRAEVTDRALRTTVDTAAERLPATAGGSGDAPGALPDAVPAAAGTGAAGNGTAAGGGSARAVAATGPHAQAQHVATAQPGAGMTLIHPGMAAAVPGQPGVAPYPAVYPAPAPRPQPVPADRPTGSMGLLYIWILLFGFVGTQLAWTLRPFFGSPGEPFGLFRNIGGTFYADVLRTIGHLFGG